MYVLCVTIDLQNKYNSFRYCHVHCTVCCTEFFDEKCTFTVNIHSKKNNFFFITMFTVNIIFQNKKN